MNKINRIEVGQIWSTPINNAPRHTVIKLGDIIEFNPPTNLHWTDNELLRGWIFHGYNEEHRVLELLKKVDEGSI